MAESYNFTNLDLGLINASKTYYVQLVSAAPLRTLTTASEISGIAIGNPTVLTGVTYTGGVFNVVDQTLTLNTYTSNHIGIVVIERIGASFSGSDLLVAYSPYVNSLGSDIILAPGTYTVTLDFATNGLFEVKNSWQYSHGDYVNNSNPYFNNGLTQLIGTRNNTTGFSDPVASGLMQSLVPQGISTVTNFTRGPGGGISMSLSTTNRIMYRFTDGGDIRFNTNSTIKWNGGASTNQGWRLSGSNFLTNGWFPASLLDSPEWTELASLETPPNSTVFNSGGIFYRYLRISNVTPGVGNSQQRVENLEIYNATVRTLSANFTP